MHKDSAKLVLYKTNFEGNSICGIGIAKAMQSGMIDKKRFRKERVGKLCGIDLMTPGVVRVRNMAAKDLRSLTVWGEDGVTGLVQVEKRGVCLKKLEIRSNNNGF